MSILLKQMLASPNTELSQEACASCQQQMSANVSSTIQNAVTTNGTTNLGPVVNGGVAPGAQQSKDESNSFTYDEGKGKKDVIQLTGPLSEVYTRALNIYYAKQPAFDADSIPDNISEKEMEDLTQSAMITPDKKQDKVAQESVQLDDSHINAILAEAQSSEAPQEAKDKFDFVNETILSDIENTDTDTTVFVAPFNDALKPEVIDVVQTKAEDKNKHVVMMVTDENKFFTRGMGTSRKWVDIAQDESFNPVFEDQTFTASVEALYVKNGITVVNGINGLIEYLNKRAA